MVPRIGNETWRPEEPTLTYSTLVSSRDFWTEGARGSWKDLKRRYLGIVEIQDSGLM